MRLIRLHLLLFSLLLLAFFLRLPHIGDSFWLDEAAQVLESSRPLSQQTRILDDFQPPLFHFIVHFMIVFGCQEAWLRLLSVVAGIATIVLLYFFIKQKEGKTVAFLSTLLLTTSSFHIFYSQELRPYSLATFFAVLSWYALMRVRKVKNIGSPNWLFILATTAGFYTMYIYPFLLLPQFLYILFCRRTLLKSFLVSCAVVLALFLPWLPTFFAQLHAGTSLTKTLPGWALAVAIPQAKALPLVVAKFFIGPVTLTGNHFLIPILIFVFLFFVYSCFVVLKKRKIYLVFWFVIPYLIVWLFSFVVPVIAPKRLMIILPAMMVLLSIGVMSLKQKWLRTIVFIVLIGINLLTSFLYYVVPKYQREDWRSTIQKLEQNAPKSSTALFAFPQAFAPWRVYSNGIINSVSSRVLDITSFSQAEKAYAPALKFKTIYLFDYLRDLSDPHHISEQWLLQHGYTNTMIINTVSIGFVRVYSKP